MEPLEYESYPIKPSLLSLGSYTSPLADALRHDLKPQTRSESNWLWTADASNSPQSPQRADAAARAAIDNFTPGAHLSALKPGHAGLASYRVDTADGQALHLKIAVPPKPEEALGEAQNASFRALRQNTAQEAARAAWAGEHEAGPRVFHIDAERGGFFSDFVTGRVPHFFEAQNALRPAYLKALGHLHAHLSMPYPRTALEIGFSSTAQSTCCKTLKNPSHRPCSTPSSNSRRG